MDNKDTRVLSTVHKNCCDSNYQKNNQLVTPGLEKVLQDSFSCFAHFETIRSKRNQIISLTKG